MTNNYQHERNNHANTTKAIKQIQPHGNKKTSLKSKVTENEK
jgi:hypothetical protein